MLLKILINLLDFDKQTTLLRSVLHSQLYGLYDNLQAHQLSLQSLRRHLRKVIGQ